jgi:hypothetical protein
VTPEKPGAYTVRAIGTVHSPVSGPADAPRQGDEAAPDAWISFVPGLDDAVRDLRPGDDVLVLTWLHLADREVLAVHSRPSTEPLSSTSSPCWPTATNGRPSLPILGPWDTSTRQPGSHPLRW